MTKQTIKRYAISSLVTFSTGFSIIFLSQIDNITMQSFQDGGFVGIVFVSVRAGVKALLEYFINKQK